MGAERNGLFTVCRDRPLEPAFISGGFDNWKKAKQKFCGHQSSVQHRFAVYQLVSLKAPSIGSQLDNGNKKQQQAARKSVIKIFTSVRYLLRQGLALRGHTENEGNFLQLFKLLADDDSDLRLYMKRKTSFVSPQAQNEIAEMYCHTIMRKLASDIQRHQIFAVVVDGTQDITGAEQESI